MIQHVHQLHAAGHGVERHDDTVTRHHAEKQVRCPEAIIEQEGDPGAGPEPEVIEPIADFIHRGLQLREVQPLTAFRRDQKLTLRRVGGMPLDAGAYGLHLQSVP